MGRSADVIMSIPSLIFALLMLSIFGTNLTVIVLVVAMIYCAAGLSPDPGGGGQRRGDGLHRGREAARRRRLVPDPQGDPAQLHRTARRRIRARVLLRVPADRRPVSFLGLGIQPPTADWGSMVRENATLISFGDITPLIPAAAIALLTVAVNFVVDWMLFRSSGLKEQ